MEGRCSEIALLEAICHFQTFGRASGSIRWQTGRQVGRSVGRVVREAVGRVARIMVRRKGIIVCRVDVTGTLIVILETCWKTASA